MSNRARGPRHDITIGAAGRIARQGRSPDGVKFGRWRFEAITSRDDITSGPGHRCQEVSDIVRAEQRDDLTRQLSFRY